MARNQDNLRRLRREHYYRNREYYIKRAAERNKVVIAEIRTAITRVFSAGCVDCGELDFVVLELDHRDPLLKTFSVSQAIRNGVSPRKILEEIEKCDPRCANCHKRRTAKDQGWWKWQGSGDSNADCKVLETCRLPLS